MNATTDSIEFNGKIYTKESLGEMDLEALTELRNIAAEMCGLRRIKSFHSVPKGVEGAFLSMSEANKFTEAYDKGETYQPQIPGADGKVRISAGPSTDPKCDEPEIVKRPTPQMFFRVKKIGTPGPSQRPQVWDRYKDGDRIIDLMERSGIHAGKVPWWVKHGLMELVDPGEKVIEDEMRQWYEAKGREFPEDAKKAAAEEKAKAKAEREAAAAAKAEEKEKAKAEAEEKRKAAAEEKKAKAEEKKAAAAEAKAEAKAKAEEKKAAAAEKKAAAAEAKG